MLAFLVVLSVIVRKRRYKMFMDQAPPVFAGIILGVMMQASFPTVLVVIVPNFVCCWEISRAAIRLYLAR